jgi:hypothetical protein
MSAHIRQLRGEERAAVGRYLRTVSFWDLLRDWRLIRRMSKGTFAIAQYLDDPFGAPSSSTHQ